MISDAEATRSLELLRSWLTPRQRADFDISRAFDVIGSSGNIFRIRGNVKSFNIEHGPWHYCVVPADAPALGDILLAQKIGLETDEEGTLRRANSGKMNEPWRPS